MTVNHRETYGGRYLNMADHRVTSARPRSTRCATPPTAGSSPTCTDAGLEPWGGVRHLAVIASPAPTHAVDVSETFDLGVASLRAHAAYLAGIGDPDPEAFLRGAAERAAARFGGRLAVTFELLGA